MIVLALYDTFMKTAGSSSRFRATTLFSVELMIV